MKFVLMMLMAAGAMLAQEAAKPEAMPEAMTEARPLSEAQQLAAARQAIRVLQAQGQRLAAMLQAQEQRLQAAEAAKREEAEAARFAELTRKLAAETGACAGGQLDAELNWVCPAAK